MFALNWLHFYLKSVKFLFLFSVYFKQDGRSFLKLLVMYIRISNECIKKANVTRNPAGSVCICICLYVQLVDVNV